jgi:hypothetical protein
MQHDWSCLSQHACYSAGMQTTQREPKPGETPLRGARIARGLGLNETARLAEIDPGHLSRAERGEVRLSLDALVRLARVLELRELAKLVAPYTREER